MNACPACGFDWDVETGDLVVALRSAPSRFDEALSDVAMIDLRDRPTPDVWSVIEYLGHVGDVVEWYGQRILLVLKEEEPHLFAPDWAAATDARRYHERHLTDLLDAVTDRCAQLAGHLDGVRTGDWEHRGIGSAGGDRSVLVLARRAVHEVEHHLTDIARRT